MMSSSYGARVGSIMGGFSSRVCTSRLRSVAFSNRMTALASSPTSGARTISSTRCLSMPLSDFRDPVSRQERGVERVDRSWSVKELRRKSFDDLHKLWLVLYKEQNMLLTEQQLSRRRSLQFPQPERIHKVRKSMGAIKQVLGERKRDHLASLAFKELSKTNNIADVQEDEFLEDGNEEAMESEPAVEPSKSKV